MNTKDYGTLQPKPVSAEDIQKIQAAIAAMPHEFQIKIKHKETK